MMNKISQEIIVQKDLQVESPAQGTVQPQLLSQTATLLTTVSLVSAIIFFFSYFSLNCFLVIIILL